MFKKETFLLVLFATLLQVQSSFSQYSPMSVEGYIGIFNPIDEEGLGTGFKSGIKTSYDILSIRLSADLNYAFPSSEFEGSNLLYGISGNVSYIIAQESSASGYFGFGLGTKQFRFSNSSFNATSDWELCYSFFGGIKFRPQQFQALFFTTGVSYGVVVFDEELQSVSLTLGIGLTL